MTFYLPTEEEFQIVEASLVAGIVPPRPADESVPTYPSPEDHDDFRDYDCCYSPDCPYSRGTQS